MKTKKTLLILTGILISFNIFSQFPAPGNFAFTSNYIHLGESDVCAGVLLNGPTYCSHFEWTAPDTLSTIAKFESYKIYYQPAESEDSTELTTVFDTSYNAELGIIGTVWVTAIYSNPDGESVASNKVLNNNLPIAIKNIQSSSNINIYYDRNLETVLLQNIPSAESIKVIDINGKIIKSAKNKSSINISELTSGLYIIDVFTRDSKRIIQKISK